MGMVAWVCQHGYASMGMVAWVCQHGHGNSSHIPWCWMVTECVVVCRTCSPCAVSCSLGLLTCPPWGRLQRTAPSLRCAHMADPAAMRTMHCCMGDEGHALHTMLCVVWGACTMDTFLFGSECTPVCCASPASWCSSAPPHGAWLLQPSLSSALQYVASFIGAVLSMLVSVTSQSIPLVCTPSMLLCLPSDCCACL